VVNRITQASSFNCTTFLIMCNVPRTRVFCRQSTESIPGIASRYFLVLYLPTPVTVTMTSHNIFHIRSTTTLILLYFNFFSDLFCITFLPNDIPTAVSCCCCYYTSD
jgi:hypothetical protein